jgi:hypothetical protein
MLIDLVCHFPGLTVNKTLRIARRPTALERILEPGIGTRRDAAQQLARFRDISAHACYGFLPATPLALALANR